MNKAKKLMKQYEPGAEDAHALLAQLARDFPPGVVSENLNKLLTATIPMKHGDRPDPNAIGVAVRILLAYRIGEPIKRIAHADMSRPETDEDTRARLDQSPAARRAMAAMLAETPEGREAMSSAMGSKPAMRVVVEAEEG